MATESTSTLNRTSATRVVATTIGVLIGLAGIEHGILELLQGHVRPAGTMIDAIGPDQRLWEYAGETAFTIVPSFLLTGILAIIVGLLVTIWSLAYIDSKYGPLVLLLLCIALFLVGGGFAPPIFMGVLAVATATRIGKPLRFWRAILPDSVRGFLAKLWPWPLVLSVLMFAIAVEIAIFGYPLLWLLPPDTTYATQFSTALLSLVLMLFSILVAFAHDIREQDKKRLDTP
jgi:hypothetical protein